MSRDGRRNGGGFGERARALLGAIWRLPRALAALLLSLGVLIALLVGGLSALGPHTPGSEVSLDRATTLLGAGGVSQATFEDQDARVVLDTQDGTVWAAYPSSASGAQTLQKAAADHGIRTVVDQQWGKRTLALLTQFILPLVLLANLFGIVMVLARGGASQVRDLFAFSRIGVRAAEGDASGAHFEGVAALDEAITELAEVRDYLADPTRFAAVGALPPKGVLLHGPPGCGKTLLARSLAGEARVPFYALSGSEFVESLVGVGAARVRDLFRRALATAPSIVFVDELDAAGRKRGAGMGGGHDEREQTLNELLVQMDGFAPSAGVVVIAATNRLDILDPALLRPGRFDRHVAVEPPDVRGRAEILRLHARSRPIGQDVDLEGVARATPGFTGADLANVVNEAALMAVRRRATRITDEDLTEAVQRVVSGPRRRGRLLTEEELRRLAVHEAGHVVLAAEGDFPATVDRVSIVARGRTAAHAGLLPRSDRTILRRGELLAEMAIAMAGTAAEELLLGEPSTASEEDLRQATDMARRFAGRFGMTPGVGRVRILEDEAEIFLGRDFSARRQVSPATLEAVDGAVRALIDEAHDRAFAVLQRRRETLETLAGALADHETLAGAELSDLLQPASPQAQAAN